MSLDRTSETIAHFSGLFQKILEDARLRQEYSEFKSDQAKVEEDALLEFSPPKVDSEYDIKDVDPQVSYVPKIKLTAYQDAQPTTALPEFLNEASFAPGDIPLLSAEPASGGTSVGVSVSTGVPFFGMGKLLPFVPVPGSVVTVTIQSIHLQDNDVFGDVEGLGFVSPEAFFAQLEAVMHLAAPLMPWSTDTLIETLFDGAASVLAFRAELNGLEGQSSAFATIVADEDVYTIRVNGEQADTLPDMDDLLPAFIKSKRDAAKEEAELAEQDTLAGHSKADVGLFDGLDYPVSSFANSGHNVVSGANEAANVVSLQTSWIDAGVIAVTGDYISLDAIAQLNILSDHNFVDGMQQDDADAESKGINISSVDTKESAVTASSEGPVFPVAWNTQHFVGDVTVTNVIKQHTIASDTDQLNLTFTANSTSIITGENQTTNFANITELSTGYDLIVVDGSMVNLNVVNQTNVLLDDDHFSGLGLSQAAISDGDNLLHNKVGISKTGVDTHVEAHDELKQAFDDIKQGVEDLVETVVNSAVFEGLKTLNVLHIDGNLTQMNIVDQINYVADQDQIHMALDAMQSVIDTVPVSITAGSNVLSNETFISASGADSDILTGGDYYSDALLYQADLIDTDANPLGVSLNDLATEAVAFLADDMVQKTVSEKLEEAGFVSDPGTGGHTLDVMQTMLA